jgi:hypothetical protein
MTSASQLLGAAAILLGFTGTWMAARRPAGWLVNLLSAALWIPPMLMGHQYAALTNAAISMIICARNYTIHLTHATGAGAIPPQHAPCVKAGGDCMSRLTAGAARDRNESRP